MLQRRIILLFAVFTLLSFECQGQNRLMLHNGQTRDFKKFKLSKDHIRIVRMSGDKEQIPVSEVEGYFDRHYQRQYYKRPGKSKYIFDTNQLPYEFVERILEGRISLYKSVRIVKSILITPPLGVNPQVEYFVEKDDVYESVLWGESSKKESLDLLQSLVREDDELFTTVSTPDFKVNLKNIMSLIIDYNLRSFQGMDANSYKSIGSIAFYVRAKNKSQDIFSVSVNDSQLYNLSGNQPLSVQVPVEVPSKVCFVSGPTKVCRVMSASPFMMLYYEVKANAGEQNFEMQRVSSKEALDYLAFMKSQ